MYVEDGVCGFYATLLLISLMSKVLKMSNSIVLGIQWPLTPTMREGYLFES